MSKKGKNQDQAPKQGKLQKKLEQKVYKTVKKKVLKKRLKERISKGQILPVRALVPLGAIIATGFSVVPVTAAVVGYQVHKAVKKHRNAELKQQKKPQALPKPPETKNAPEEVPVQSLPADSK